ncbi:MAG: methionyl-tRNA formyltransferase [Ignavibacteria bacterium]|nr:MAG: methionyl-tRNA formyltransferase [Ignavibacteria bacterium]
MNIIFMGTPDFSIPSLITLIESKHNVLAVVTAPDKQRGRGRKVSFTSVKEFAIKNNLPVLQPERLKNNSSFVDELKQFDADLYVVVAFRILPADVFEIPKYGSFNLHASYLPKYRGAAPIQWALINGETETGLTTFKLAEKVDTGNIYLQMKIEINTDDNLETLHDKLSAEGSKIVLDTVNLIDSGDYVLQEQNNTLATPAPKITKEVSKIDWSKPAYQIHNLIRGLSPIPGAFFEFDGKLIKIYKTELVERVDLKPLEFDQTKKELIVGCGNKALRILELQQEGRKRMKIEEFLRGFSF